MMSEQRLFRMLATLTPALMLAGSACAGDATEPILFRDVVSTEFAVDPVLVYMPTPGRWPAVAFDGTQYLVVWEDHRMRRPILYGGRIAADGSSLDPLGFPILDAIPSPAGPSDNRVEVAAGGGNFMVVTAFAGQLRGVRVSAAGEVLDPEGIVIATLIRSVVAPSLIFDGEQYVVAWVDGTSPPGPGPDNGVHWARVKPDGTVLDPDGVRLAASDGWPPPAGLSFDGTNYLLSWMADDPEGPFRMLEAVRLAPDGTWIDQTPIRISPEGKRATAGIAGYSTAVVGGFDGTNHVIAWQGLLQSDLGDWHNEISMSRVTPDGVLLEPEGLVAVPYDVGDGVSLHRLDMAAGDGRSVVVWSRDYSGPGAHALPIRALHITADGTSTEHPQDALPLGLEASVALHPGGGGLMLWREGNHRDEDYPAIVGARIDVTGLPVADGKVVPAMPASRQDVRAAAFDGENFFVVWSDTRDPAGNGSALFGARIGPGKIPLDLEPIQISAKGTTSVNVVFDGANFLVNWARKRDSNDHYPLNTARVSPTGELLDAVPLHPPLDTGGGCDTLAAASDGEHTLLVGIAYIGGNHLGAVLVDHNVAVASEIIPLTHPHEGVGFGEAVSFAGAGYLVSWISKSGDLGQQILGQRISSDGTPVGERFTIVARDYFYNSAVAGGGGIHLVVWQEQNEIWATRVSADGQVLDPDGHLVAVTAANPESQGYCFHALEVTSANYMAAAYDDEDFVVAWRAPAIADDLDTLDLYAAKLSKDGEVLGQFPISQAPGREGPPALAGADGRVLAAYARFVPGEAHDTRRALARLLVSKIELASDVDFSGSQSGSADDIGDSHAGVQASKGGCRSTTDDQRPTSCLLLLTVVALARRRPVIARALRRQS